MPVLQIQWFEPPTGVAVRDVLSAVNTAVARAMGCPPEQVWSTWTTIEPGCYAEGDDAAEGPRTGTYPPIARLMAFEGRDERVIESALVAAADALARALGLEPGSAFVVYDELVSGRVFTGGSVRRADR